MKKSFCLPFILMLIISCDNDSISPSSEAVETMNLKIGNYWVYQWYEIDPSGQTKLLDKKDSIIIKNDSTINGKTYFVRSGNLLGSELITKTLLYDSMNSIYSYPDRRLWLTLDKSIASTHNFGAGNSIVAIGYYSIDKDKVSVEVPAGNFDAINFRGRIESQISNYPYGIRFNDNYYAYGVGLIKMRTQLYSSPDDIEMRLVKYGQVNNK